MSLSCIMVIKNGISNGYPFLESIRSIVDIADEFLISDGCSEDGTYDYLELCSKKFANIKLYRDPWPISGHGEVIADVTNKLKQRAAGDWVYNLQADEVIHEGLLAKLDAIAKGHCPEFRSFAVNFLHFVGDFCHIETLPGYSMAVRLVPNDHAVRVAGDGWTFEGALGQIGLIQEPPLFHFGWVYALNNISKRKNQACSIYSEEESYKDDYRLCEQVEQWAGDAPENVLGWQRKMLAVRRIRPYQGEYPKACLHLLTRGNLRYSPDAYALEINLGQGSTAEKPLTEHYE